MGYRMRTQNRIDNKGQVRKERIEDREQKIEDREERTERGEWRTSNKIEVREGRIKEIKEKRDNREHSKIEDREEGIEDKEAEYGEPRTVYRLRTQNRIDDKKQVRKQRIENIEEVSGQRSEGRRQGTEDRR